MTGRAILDLSSHTINIYQGGFLGGLVGNNLPANVGDMGSILGLVTANAAEQLSLCPMTTDPVF